MTLQLQLALYSGIKICALIIVMKYFMEDVLRKKTMTVMLHGADEVFSSSQAPFMKLNGCLVFQCQSLLQLL